jgi:hypothetical protein
MENSLGRDSAIGKEHRITDLSNILIEKKTQV